MRRPHKRTPCNFRQKRTPPRQARSRPPPPGTGRPGQGRRRRRRPTLRRRRRTTRRPSSTRPTPHKATANADLQQAQDDQTAGGCGSRCRSGQRQCGGDSRQPSWPRTRLRRTRLPRKRRQTPRPPMPRLLPRPMRPWFRPSIYSLANAVLTKLGGTPLRAQSSTTPPFLPPCCRLGSAAATPVRSRRFLQAVVSRERSATAGVIIAVLAAGGLSGGNASAFAKALAGGQGANGNSSGGGGGGKGSSGSNSPQAKGCGYDGRDRKCHRQRWRRLEHQEIAARRALLHTTGGDLTCFAMQHCISTKPR